MRVWDHEQIYEDPARYERISHERATYTVFPLLVRARTNTFSQSNHVQSNRGRELIKGAPYYFSHVYLVWCMHI